MPPGAKVAIPNDPTNGARALLVLQAARLITLKPGVTVTASLFDIAENPKNLKFIEIEAAQLPHSLKDVDAAAVNSAYAIPAGLSPARMRWRWKARTRPSRPWSSPRARTTRAIRASPASSRPTSPMRSRPSSPGSSPAPTPPPGKPFMSSLTIYSEDAPDQGRTLRDAGEIGRELAAIGVRFERWRAQAPLARRGAGGCAGGLSGTDRPAGRRARLPQRGRGQPGPVPSRARALRAKFLAEHTHADDEVRFFVAGSGLFVLHAEGRVYAALCEQDDLISVPAGIRHWFDMGSSPAFTCIRLFNDPAGWVARFTGDDIATRFPTLA